MPPDHEAAEAVTPSEGASAQALLAAALPDPDESAVVLPDDSVAALPSTLPSTLPDDATAPLLTLLFSLEKVWGAAQEQVLTLACALQASGRYAVRVCCPADAPLAARLRAHHPTLAPLSLVPVSSPRDIFSLFRLWRCQRRKSPLLLHSFDSDALQLAERLTHLRRPRSTLLLHSCLHQPPEKNEKKEGARRVWQVADRILCASGVVRAALADSGLDVARLVVVHVGCDPAALPLRRERGDGRFVFVAVEALQQGAGLFVLLRAMAALWQRLDLPPWEVRVVGQGEALTSILDEARSLGVESRLALLSQQDLGEVLPRCDALLVPNRLPSGNIQALLTAWCCALPLVCTDIPPHREVTRANHTALCVPPGDAQALAAAMIRLMTDPDLCVQLVARGEGMREYASHGRVVTQTLAQYDFCLARQGWVLPVTPAAVSPKL